jgi:cytochrome c5
MTKWLLAAGVLIPLYSAQATQETLVQHVTQGFKAMPPRGLCMDCSAEDYQAIIQWMSE